MAVAIIEINGVAGSNDDLPIDTLVQLSNDDAGDETTYTWAILAQPPGAADAISDVGIENPTITPKKEGTYLLRLTVDIGLASEVTDTVVLAVRHLKTFIRIPAPGESVETGADGWAEPARNEALRQLDATVADPGILTAYAGGAGLSVGRVVRVSDSATIKAGLPGEEVIASVTAANALTEAASAGPLLVLLGRVAGAGAPALGELVRGRMFGLHGPLVGNIAAGTPAYLTDAGAISTTAGTVARQVGVSAGTDGVSWWVWFDGMSGSALGAAFLLNQPFMLHTAPTAALPGAMDVSAIPTAVTDPSLAIGAETAAGLEGTVHPVMVLEHNPVLPGVNGIGTSLMFRAKSSNGSKIHAGAVEAVLTDANPGTYAAELRLWGLASALLGTLDVEGLIIAGAGARGFRRTGGDLDVKVVTAHPIKFIIGGVEHWRVDETSGALLANVLKRRIENLADPTGDTHAVPRGYADARYAPAPLIWGIDNTGTVGPVYAAPGYGPPVGAVLAFSAPQAGTMRDLRVRIESPIHDDTLTFTVYKNGGATALTVTVPAATSTAADVANSFTFAAGDAIALQLTFGGGITVAAQKLLISAQVYRGT